MVVFLNMKPNERLKWYVFTIEWYVETENTWLLWNTFFLSTFINTQKFAQQLEQKGAKKEVKKGALAELWQSLLLS